MIFVQGWIRASASDLQKMVPILQEMATESNKEEGCLHYSFAIDIADSDLLRLTERWQSEDDLNAHFQTEHMAKFNTAVGAITIKGMDVRMYSGEETKIMMQS